MKVLNVSEQLGGVVLVKVHHGRKFILFGPRIQRSYVGKKNSTVWHSVGGRRCSTDMEAFLTDVTRHHFRMKDKLRDYGNR